jgi:tetratricopeptide (TPR) repeat protein
VYPRELHRWLRLAHAAKATQDEAEQMYERALREYEEVLGPTHTSTLATVDNLGSLYKIHGKLDEAEQMYKRKLEVHESVV